MNCYPVIIPTLNRCVHLKRCVESLAKCKYADQTELVVGLDYPPAEKYREGYETIRSYLSTISGFGKVTILEHKKNLGAIENTNRLVDYCRGRYDAFIFTEDDNEFSPCFLDFMNQTLSKYIDDERVDSVCGYSDPAKNFEHANKAYLTFNACAWGLGCWLKKRDAQKQIVNEDNWTAMMLRRLCVAVKILFVHPALLRIGLDMVQRGCDWGDVKNSIYNIVYGKLQLRPYISLVRNCGSDGSGEHCEDDHGVLASQVISSDCSFDFGAREPRIDNACIWKQGMPDKFIPYLFCLKYTILRYFEFIRNG